MESICKNCAEVVTINGPLGLPALQQGRYSLIWLIGSLDVYNDGQTLTLHVYDVEDIIMYAVPRNWVLV